MSTRRIFLKQALTLMAGATVVTPTLMRAIEHVQKYHPEVQAVLDRIPGNVVTSQEKRTISNFVLSQIECGNWDLIDSFHHVLTGDVNWKGNEEANQNRST